MIQMLDCTLRDGAYIVNSNFGVAAIKGIIKKMQDANVDIIECGWLKDKEHVIGTSFYHVPQDLKQYIIAPKKNCQFVVMIDWDRYDLTALPDCDYSSIDAIRVVFPHGKHKEGIEVARKIAQKGYHAYLQAANTLAYSNEELIDLADEVNQSEIESLSIVDTFGAMYYEDLKRIVEVLDNHLRKDIKLGFHSHNNQQLSFALSIFFVDWIITNSTRNAIVDASLCGMGRGAGNATTELIANYLNRHQLGNYDMDSIMDAIDTYMQPFLENYKWGYSTPYFIAGVYCCHVNNIAYLINNHRTNAKDMRNIIQSMSEEERRKYDYDLLEQKYIDNQSRSIDDTLALEELGKDLEGKEILLIAPGRSVTEKKTEIDKYIKEAKPTTIHVNAISADYPADYLFFINEGRYEYAQNSYPDVFRETKKIVLSGITRRDTQEDLAVNFNSVIKTGWEHFDNAVIYCLRLLDRLGIKKVKLAGFDEFLPIFSESYADKNLPTISKEMDWIKVNQETRDMFRDFMLTNNSKMEIEFLTRSGFEHYE